MLIIFVRTIILYLAVFIVIRLMGKRQVGQMQPSELIVTIMTADIATAPLEGVDTPLFSGLVPLIAMFALQTIMTYLILKSHVGRKLITGKPIMIMKDGVILEEEMKKLQISISDLYEEIRFRGHPRLHEINYIIFETNGELSIIPKEDSTVPINVIADGRRLDQNLEEWDISKKWLNKELNKAGINSDEEVFLAYVDDKKLYIHRKDQKQ